MERKGIIMNVLIGISWPFANGELHLGHAASSLSGDVIARYYRLKGDNVCLVSGTDCHGTPISIKALNEKKKPKDIVDDCHERFAKDWQDLGISFDLYNLTDDLYHKEFVQDIFKKYYKKGYLYEKVEKQLYCKNCNLFLADRYVVGVCPKCGALIKGDECEDCGSLLNIKDVKDKKCAICGNNANEKETKNLYFALSEFQKVVEDLSQKNKEKWRNNALDFTRRYLKEGISDRCASRSLNWGIDIPILGYDDKKIYGWFENVWGYVTACKKYCEANGLNWENFWKKDKDNKIYLVHAKDNIPFHTVIFPILLSAAEDNYKLPDYIVSDNYLTIEGEKLSKSKGNYISLRYLLDNYSPDLIRYFLLINDPDKKDFNFSWNNFINSNNAELLGKWGNFVNRTLIFINKSFAGKLCNNILDLKIESQLKELFGKIGNNIEQGNIKEGLQLIFNFIGTANKYFDENQPWNLIKVEPKRCEEVLFNCCNIIFNVNILLKPYLPVACEKVEKFINNYSNKWQYTRLTNVKLSEDIEVLFVRYDKKIIDKETKKLFVNRETK